MWRTVLFTSLQSYETDFLEDDDISTARGEKRGGWEKEGKLGEIGGWEGIIKKENSKKI